LADDFARNGFKTIIPDILHGDPIPTEAFNPGVCTSVLCAECALTPIAVKLRHRKVVHDTRSGPNSSDY
jgi:hypothetical protein